VIGNEGVAGKWADTAGLVGLFADEAKIPTEDLGTLNALVTESLVFQQKKHVQPGEVPNFINLFLATNFINPIGGMTKDARRFVCSSPLDFETLCGAGRKEGKVLAHQFVTAVSKACQSPTSSEAAKYPERFGASKAMYELAFFLRHRYDVSEWNQKGRFRKAVHTKEFRRLVNLNAGTTSPLEQYAVHLILEGSNSPSAPPPVKRKTSARDPTNAVVQDPEWYKRNQYETNYGHFKPKGNWFRFVPLSDLHQDYIVFVQRFQLRSIILQEIQFGQELAAIFAGSLSVGTLAQLAIDDPGLDIPDYLRNNFLDKHFAVFSGGIALCKDAVSRATGSDIQINSKEQDVLSVPAWFQKTHDYEKIPVFLQGKIFTPKMYRKFPKVAMFAHYKWTELCQWFDLQKRKWQREVPEEESAEEESEDMSYDAMFLEEDVFQATRMVPPEEGTPLQQPEEVGLSEIPAPFQHLDGDGGQGGGGDQGEEDG
jgi:hypothetical protein